uniref:BEN domain-containing protein 6 n=1 Tax=Schizaphis graminum TaxID=13262 RepID=A0A2S2NI93_SCHGA
MIKYLHSPCRSKRHERHVILSKSTVTDKNKMVKTTNASTKRKYAELSSSSILKKLNNKKEAVEPYQSDYEDHNIDKSEDSNETQKAVLIEKSTVFEDIASSIIDQSKTMSSENWVELWPKSGIEVNSFALSTINRKSPSKMISDLMVIIFNDDELRNGSVTGKKSNFMKCEELKKKLNDQKVKAIKDFTQDIFKDVTDEIINKALRTKLNNFSKKQKT